MHECLFACLALRPSKLILIKACIIILSFWRNGKLIERSSLSCPVSSQGCRATPASSFEITAFVARAVKLSRHLNWKRRNPLGRLDMFQTVLFRSLTMPDVYRRRTSTHSNSQVRPSNGCREKSIFLHRTCMTSELEGSTFERRRSLVLLA